MAIIQTSQAPDAKPIGVSITLSDQWQTIIEVPSYEIPEESFGGGTVVVPGVAEIISPMLICNRSNFTQDISIKIYRNDSEISFFVANQLKIPANETMFFPLNGQFIYTGDLLEILCSGNDVVDMTLSYTVGQAEQDDIV
jgi:hypothetical protein